MEWLKILAITMSLADGAYSCKQINSGVGIENNNFMPKTCKGIIIQKSVMLIPMYAIRSKKYQTVFTITNIAGGSVGLGISIYNMNK